MADAFADQLRSELAGIQSEVERLENKRRLIQELLNIDSGGTSVAALPVQRRAARRATGTPKRTRRPRGLITAKVREFLSQQSEAIHATEILAFLEKNDAAPQSIKPMPTLQSTLQRMKEMGEIENEGRNRWTLVSNKSGSGSASEVRSDTPPVVTSTTTFGTRPLGNQ